MQDLFKEMEELNTENIVVSKKRRGRTCGGVVKFEFSPEDNDLMRTLKELVNAREITYSDVYNIHGKGLGWNMIHSVRNGQITWERFKKWMQVLNLEATIHIKELENK